MARRGRIGSVNVVYMWQERKKEKSESVCVERKEKKQMGDETRGNLKPVEGGGTGQGTKKRGNYIWCLGCGSDYKDNDTIGMKMIINERGK